MTAYDTLRARWASVPPETLAAGLAWYPAARAEVRRMAREHGLTVPRAAAVVAVLSPRQHWARNVSTAQAVLRGETPRGVLGACLTKAIAVRDWPDGCTRWRGLVSGPKVRAFAAALAGRDAPVVDVWMLRSAGLDASDTRRAYTDVAPALVRLASEVGHPVCGVQAALWVHERGRAG